MNTFVQKEGEGKGKRVEVIKGHGKNMVLRNVDTGFVFNISSFVFSKLYKEEKDDRKRH